MLELGLLELEDCYIVASKNTNNVLPPRSDHRNYPRPSPPTTFHQHLHRVMCTIGKINKYMTPN